MIITQFHWRYANRLQGSEQLNQSNYFLGGVGCKIQGSLCLAIKQLLVHSDVKQGKTFPVVTPSEF